MLAPNAPLRAALTALPVAKDEAPIPTAMSEAVPATEPGATVQNVPEEVADEPTHRKAARYYCALLLARIHEVLPLVCPKFGVDMRIISFINEGPVIREILGPLGEPTSAPYVCLRTDRPIPAALCFCLRKLNTARFGRAGQPSTPTASVGVFAPDTGNVGYG